MVSLTEFVGFDWDDGNRSKCGKHGVSISQIEEVFQSTLAVLPDVDHSQEEPRFRAIGRNANGRLIFVVFMMRERNGNIFIRPISARYMHRKEIATYEEENPQLQDR